MPDRARADSIAEARRWLAIAQDDLHGALAMLERDDVAPGLACFLAQQAAEKAIKARLISERPRSASRPPSLAGGDRRLRREATA